MIARDRAPWQAPVWQRRLAEAITDPAELLALLELDPRRLPGARAAASTFRLRVPRGYVARMQAGNPADPLLRQVLPLGAELEQAPGYLSDPVGDLGAAAAPGVLHKYHGRALLVLTGACAVHCRYCFRRHFPYAGASLGPRDTTTALDYLGAHTELSEIVLSGGDPLVLPDERLAALAATLGEIPHLRRLRIHTRLPVVLPERITEALIGWLGEGRLKPVLVIHANHANEIDDAVVSVLNTLKRAGVELLNQSVLLRGVNDDAAILAALSERLFESGVLPYYLHLLDPVQGAAHFHVEEDRALALQQQLRNRLPGYLVPRLVRELAGAPSKISLEKLIRSPLA